MGIQTFGAPRAEIEFFKSKEKIEYFIETGTFRGETTRWAASLFGSVITIEGSPEIHHETSKALSEISNIKCLCGDSRSLVPGVLSGIDNHQKILFWLDAHWMPGSFGESAECPLLEEIELILKHSHDHIILIDDARLFLAPPPLPHKASNWPTIDQVVDLLHREIEFPRYTVVYNDVIFSVPANLKAITEEYFQSKTTEKMNAPNEQPPILRRLIRKLLGC